MTFCVRTPLLETKGTANLAVPPMLRQPHLELDSRCSEACTCLRDRSSNSRLREMHHACTFSDRFPTAWLWLLTLTFHRLVTSHPAEFTSMSLARNMAASDLCQQGFQRTSRGSQLAFIKARQTSTFQETLDPLKTWPPFADAPPGVL